MDAISFVLGLQSNYLRSSNFKELIYKNSNSITESSFAMVSLFYEKDNGTITIFSRK